MQKIKNAIKNAMIEGFPDIVEIATALNVPVIEMQNALETLFLWLFENCDDMDDLKALEYFVNWDVNPSIKIWLALKVKEAHRVVCIIKALGGE